MPFNYDAKCEDLARHFLADADDMDKRAAQLAQHIQEAVEQWFIGVEDEQPNPLTTPLDDPRIQKMINETASVWER